MGASFALGSLVHPASEAIKQLARLGGHIDGDLLAIHIQAELLGVLARDLVQRAYRPGTREVLGSRGGAGMCTVRGGGVGAGDGEVGDRRRSCLRQHRSPAHSGPQRSASKA